ncbi:outer membrane protein [Aeromonas sp. RU39B]|uniref:TIGR04219 family outer membrane beta-barrel protein n=1 Tax=Aeromonas sp. RU39B TaxID=1907416 RepID=UPI000955E274|nr:TIGR04219 family outer membrane beta-barrel protein [Aeromonas sp. RU39B]SIQ58339.1 outer membrane protein [Aeromonas sp. RU39B]
MKKTLLAGCVLALCSSAAMAANDWHFAAGSDLWHAQGSGDINSVNPSYDNNYNWSGYALLEHGILVLPNIKFELANLDTSGGSFNNDLLTYNMDFYYRVFNNDLFNIDLGAAGRRYDGEFRYHGTDRSYTKDSVLAYAAAELRIPSTSLSVFGDAHASSWGSDKTNDYRFGAAYKLPTMPLKVHAGWREVNLDLNHAGVDANQNIDGWFVGGEMSF